MSELVGPGGHSDRIRAGERVRLLDGRAQGAGATGIGADAVTWGDVDGVVRGVDGEGGCVRRRAATRRSAGQRDSRDQCREAGRSGQVRASAGVVSEQ